MSLAAVGLLSAALPLGVAAASGSDGDDSTSPQPLDTSTAMPTPGGTPFMVYVSDPSSGSGTILIGEQSVPFSDPGLVQRLQQALN